MRVLTPITDPQPGADLIPDLFLAGGIRGCPDWQQQTLDLLTRLNTRPGTPELLVANPRRPGDLATTGVTAAEQIAWEHEMLLRSRTTLFWFCAETIQPIVLFELGKALGRDDEVVVGVDPDYSRAFDVRIQHLLEAGTGPIHESLDETVRRAHEHAVFLRTASEDDKQVIGIAKRTSRDWALTSHILGAGRDEELDEEQQVVRTVLRMQNDFRKARREVQG